MFNTRNMQMLINSGAIKSYRKKYRFTKRFFVILGYLTLVLIIILSMLFIDYSSLVDKLTLKKYVTSPYWKAVFK